MYNNAVVADEITKSIITSDPSGHCYDVVVGFFGITMNKSEKKAKWRTENRDKLIGINRQWREDNREYFVEYRKRPEAKAKANASNKINNAIRAGKMTRDPCEVCGNPKSEGHHDDYSKPLEVRWLCKKHHTEHHLNEKRKLIK